MKQIYHILSLIGLVLVLACHLGAQDYSIALTTGETTPPTFNSMDFEYPSAFAGNRYLILQFYDLPNNYQKIQLGVAGVQLFDYIPHNAFLAKVPEGVDLSTLPIRSAIPIPAASKMSLRLQQGDYAPCAYKSGVVFLNIMPMPLVSLENLQNSIFANFGVRGKATGNVLKISIEESKIPELAALQGIKSMESIQCEPVKDGIRGVTLGRMNGDNGYTQTPFCGEGVGIAIGDDGGVNHIDFKGRLFDHTTSQGGNHGDMTSGLAIGAGNLNPYGMGMATRSYLHLYDIAGMPHVVNAIQSYFQDGVVITSTSFSEGCSAVYNFVSAEIDEQVYSEPHLLHFFSAGNSSGNPCNPVYGQVSSPFGIHFGNITGGRKCAKDVIAVGNVRYNDSLFVLSSRGPALDGRIKPDICAHGQGNLSTDENNGYRWGGGTSAASPTAAGGAALLYEAYRLLNVGVNPESGLVKALMLNTTEDLGRPGPDFEYGWGRLHIGRAIKTLTDGQYFESNISHHFQKYHQITIPEGVKEARVMVYWTDPAGSPLSSRALVNDIDIAMINSSGVQFKPLVLSTVPQIDSLTKPAYPGEDHVNNVEQVVLRDPQAGSYNLKVFGNTIVTPAQKYFVVYTFIRDEITITYPNNDEGFVPGQKEVIRWDAYGDEGTFNVEYSVDSMQTWITIQNDVPGGRRFLDWWVPYVVTGDAFIRITRNNQSDVSDGHFNIIGQPYFDVDKVNDNTAKISWMPVEGADGYDIFMLTERFMEKVGETDDLAYLFHTQVGDERWISVRAKNHLGTMGRRSNAKRYVHRACNSQFTLNFTFDLYPSETSWVISQDGEELMTGGPYVGVPPNSFLSEVKCLPAGCYTLTISDSYGDGICCDRGNGHFELYDGNGALITSGGDFAGTKILYFCIEENTQSFSAGISGVEHASCANSSDGSATVFAIGGSGNYTYLWSNGFSGPHPTNLSPGVYSVSISDGVSTTISDITITSPAQIDIQLSAYPIPCNGTQGGNITSTVSGGTPPYQYHWDDDSQQPFMTNAQEGVHWLTITDSHGCTASAQVVMTRAGSLEVQLQAAPVSCAGGANGGVLSQVTGGTPPYSYQWSTGSTSTSLSGLPAGSYQVTVQDNFGCQGFSEITLTSPEAIDATLLGQSPACNQESNGTIQVVSSGGTGMHQYNWSTGSSGTAVISQLPAGNYTVTVTDELGCTTIKAITLVNPSAINVQASVMNPTSNDGGSIDLTVSGGVPPYQYHWSNNADTEDLYGLAAGQYSVTVTDANGCSRSITKVLQAEQSDDYCLARGSNTQHEWIQSVAFAGMENISGPDNGLGNYIGVVFNVVKGWDYELELTPGFLNYPFNENWRVWIDYNHDFDFDDPGELVVQQSFYSGVVSNSITIPYGAITGTTRMRIAMRYGTLPENCGTFAYGEVEDYSINIMPFSGGLAQQSTLQDRVVIDNTKDGNKEQQINEPLLPYPNPASEKVFVDFTSDREGEGFIYLYDINYKRVAEEAVTLHKGTNVLSIPVNYLPAGIYQIEIENEEGILNRQTFVVQHSQ